MCLSKEKIITFLICLAMITFPILECIGNILGYKFFFQEEIMIIIGIFYSTLIVFFIILKIIETKTLRISFVFSDIFIIFSLLFCLISFIYSKDKKRSFFGEYAYSESPFQVLGYFSLFFLCTLISKDKNKKYIVLTFLVLGIFESLIAFAQNFKFWSFESYYDPSAHKNLHLAFGLTQHCNWYAALSIIFTSIFTSMYIYENNKKKSKVFFIASIFCCLGTLFTYTRISWIGTFSILFGLFILEILLNKILKKNKEYLKIFLTKFKIIALSFLICFLLVGISSGNLSKDISNSLNELKDFESFGTNRGIIWKVGINSLKSYPLTGVGFDNYRYSFIIYPEKTIFSQNKAHNEYIHILVTQGIPSGINYFLFTLYCCYFPFRQILKLESTNGNSKLKKIFLITIFAYFVQALFNSSITNVAPYKWIIMGLLLPRVEQKNTIKKAIQKMSEKN